jgi:hypothetical protein
VARSTNTRPNLADRYATTTGPVVFVDETFQLPNTGHDPFYVVCAAVLPRDMIETARKTVSEFSDDTPIHASKLWEDRHTESLRIAVDLVAEASHRNHVVVKAAIDPQDTTGEAARKECLQHLVTGLAKQQGAGLFVADSRNKPRLDRLDTESVHDLRTRGLISRDTALVHARPSEEPLLGMADVVGWTYRQVHIRSDRGHFYDGLRDVTTIHDLARVRRSPSAPPAA